jgi:DNA-binding response OmpR family regulator
MSSQAAAAVQLQSKTSAGARILLVEDNARVRTPLVDLLQAWGYEVESAGDGFEALSKAAQFHPDVVVSDLRMPRLNGAQLIRELRARTPRMKFILYSGQRPDEQDLMGLEGICFLQKPFDPARLREQVEKCLKELLP